MMVSKSWMVLKRASLINGVEIQRVAGEEVSQEVKVVSDSIIEDLETAVGLVNTGWAMHINLSGSGLHSPE